MVCLRLPIPGRLINPRTHSLPHVFPSVVFPVAPTTLLRHSVVIRRHPCSALPHAPVFLFMTRARPLLL
jgi:hypothetical protein